MQYEDIPAGERSELYFKALELVRQAPTLPFFFDGPSKEDLARSLAVKMFQESQKKQ